MIAVVLALLCDVGVPCDPLPCPTNIVCPAATPKALSDPYMRPTSQVMVTSIEEYVAAGNGLYRKVVKWSAAIDTDLCVQQSAGLGFSAVCSPFHDEARATTREGAIRKLLAQLQNALQEASK